MRPEFPREFQELCRMELGLELTDEEALEHATAILDMFRAIYRPLPTGERRIYTPNEPWYNEDTTSKP